MAMGANGKIRKATFKKSERLTSKKLIDELFEKGEKLKLSGILVVYLLQPNDFSQKHQVLISVAKKKFPRSTDRNLLKRRIREAYRKNKSILYEQELPGKLIMAYIYNHNSIKNYSLVEQEVVKALVQLKESMSHR